MYPLGNAAASVLGIKRLVQFDRLPTNSRVRTDIMKIRLTRRQAATILITICGGAAVGWGETSRAEKLALELSLPPPDNPDAPSFEVFEALSRIVLLRDRLNEQAVRQMYELFMDEPWGPKHIHTSYEELRTALIERNRKVDAKNPSPLRALGPAKKWFVSHLVSTWYLGVYYHQERPTRRVLYEHAIMFDSIRGVIPIPFFENTGFGAWAEPPPRKDPLSHE